MSDTVVAMIFTLHALVALAGVFYTAFAYTAPTAARLRTVYGLLTITLAGGVYLVLNTNVRLVLVGLVGIIYVGSMLYIASAARRKLAYRIVAKAVDDYGLAPEFEP